MSQQLGHRGIVQGRHQAGAPPGLLDGPKHDGQGLIKPGVPGHIAHQLQLIGLTTIPQLNATCQHRVASQQHTTAGTAAVQQVQPVAVGDLTEVTETAALLERPQALSIATVDRLPGQTRWQAIR